VPQLLPALAARAAVVATAAAAASLAAVLPATTSAAAPAPTASVTTVVAAPVQTIAFTAPARATAPRLSAMNSALGKLGAPYRWGATGPGAFDCSGLLKWSFAKAGISLPRTSRAQSQFGTPVSKANLQPGDAVFFYRPVSHAAIYIGNGKVVHASTSGQPVKISNLNAMPFTTARRY
jgi:peptidoglycan DL-endopeptidase CwlO